MGQPRFYIPVVFAFILLTGVMLPVDNTIPSSTESILPNGTGEVATSQDDALVNEYFIAQTGRDPNQSFNNRRQQPQRGLRNQRSDQPQRTDQPNRSQRGLQRRSMTNRRQKQMRRLRNKRRGVSGSGAVRGAQTSLRRFRQSTMLAVVLTSLIFLFVGTSDTDSLAQNTNNGVPDTVAVIEPIETQTLIEQAQRTDSAAADPPPVDATDEALGTLRSLWMGFFDALPKIFFAILAFLVAWLFIKVVKWALRLAIGRWQSADAVITVVSIALWLFATAVALSIIAGDIRALVGSVGLIGLALSWALQSPIESFTAWLLNSFRRYYRIGDRIAVGEIMGDVYKIDFLTTTVWEIGSPFRGTFVQAEQPTGRLVTFPNNEILSGTVVNYTRDFPFVWDELPIQVANESDVNYTLDVLSRVANQLLGDYMKGPASQYEIILQQKGLEREIPIKPQIFLSTNDSGTDYVIRYLVGAQERRKWKSDLVKATTIEMNKPEHKGKIIAVYPRQQIQFFSADGTPAKLPGSSDF